MNSPGYYLPALSSTDDEDLPVALPPVESSPEAYTTQSQEPAVVLLDAAPASREELVPLPAAPMVTAPAAAAPLQAPPRIDLRSLIPLRTRELSQEESDDVQRLILANRILGPANGSIMLCPGNQQNSLSWQAHSKCCPYYLRCPILKAQKCITNELCPFERENIVDRFEGWCSEIKAIPETLEESERVVVSDLAWMDTQLQRIAGILASGSAARLTDISIKDSDDHGNPLAWEKVLHVVTQLQQQITTQRRMYLDEWELTPKSKTRRDKALGKNGSGLDQSSQHAAKRDTLNSVLVDVD